MLFPFSEEELHKIYERDTRKKVIKLDGNYNPEYVRKIEKLAWEEIRRREFEERMRGNIETNTH